MSDTKKIDLDELERKARAATPGPWCWIHGDFADTLKRLGDQEVVLRIPDDDRSIYPHPRNCSYLVRSSPDVVLALIARIRELERGYGGLVAECEERTENPEGDYYSEHRELLARGVVLQ